MPNKPRILFVDDEKNIIDGIKRMLYPMRKEWEMIFTTSGQKALDYMAEHPVNVIISDMRMPEMDGSELLNTVKERHPQTARYILSGYSDKEMILKTIDSADQFLSKPCNPNLIKRVIQKVLNNDHTKNKQRALEYISRIEKLPTLPAVYEKLTRIMKNPECSAKLIASVIQQDVAMSAKILQLVNSTFFGLKNEVNDLTQAVTFLGFDVVKAVIVSVETFNQFTEDEMKTFDVDMLYAHATRCSIICKEILSTQTENKELLENALITGLLHDIGILVLVKNEPAKYATVFEASGSQMDTLIQSEKMIMGITHAEVGGVLLEQWGFRESIVNAVYYHHTPEDAPEVSFGLTHAMHITDVLERNPDLNPDSPIQLNRNHLDEMGLSESIPEWQKIVKECT
ncbi:MAG: response regulator [Fibrobacterales bacterium]